MTVKQTRNRLRGMKARKYRAALKMVTAEDKALVAGRAGEFVGRFFPRDRVQLLNGLTPEAAREMLNLLGVVHRSLGEVIALPDGAAKTKRLAQLGRELREAGGKVCPENPADGAGLVVDMAAALTADGTQRLLARYV